jgi:hypothetical protein
MVKLFDKVKEFGFGIRHGYMEAARGVYSYFRGSPTVHRPLASNTGRIGAFLGSLLLALATPVLAGIGMNRTLDSYVGYTAPPASRIVYYENGRPSYEVVTEQAGGQSITNHYSGQSVVGESPLRRGPLN